MGVEQIPAAPTDNQRLSSRIRFVPAVSESPGGEVVPKTQDEEPHLIRADLTTPRERMIFDLGGGGPEAIEQIMKERKPKPRKKQSLASKRPWHETAGNVPENS